MVLTAGDRRAFPALRALPRKTFSSTIRKAFKLYHKMFHVNGMGIKGFNDA